MIKLFIRAFVAYFCLQFIDVNLNPPLGGFFISIIFGAWKI
jgi:hypothetical protein